MLEWRGKPDAGTAFTDQADYLQQCLVVNIEAFRKRRLHNRSVAFGTKMGVASIGAATTLVLGLKPYLTFPIAITGFPVQHWL
jgi:hypothetical protein